jgi:choline dehydrogenase-like flavoprotein
MAETYDYVIIGAGSAGCAVAGRLSELTDASVAIVEAGPPSAGRLFEIPALFSRQLKSFYDWDFETDPEPELEGRRKYLPRGRVVGGSSAMNTMLYVRGNRADYDNWQRLGATGWAYDDVLPYFTAVEDNERGADEYHGSGGPLAVSDARSVHPLLSDWVAAAQEAGLPATADFNGASQEGVGVYQVTQRAGRRCSSARAFLDPAAAQDNLTVLHSTLALRIVWSGSRAVGVEVDHDGDVHTIAASREVILSAGAYQSPHLLLLSGVGPADELAAFGIKPMLDLPGVGRNLQDHVGSLLAYSSATEHLLTGSTAEAEAELMATGDGPMTWTEVGGFVRSRPGIPAPDLQFHAALGLSIDEGLGPATESGISFGPYVARPESRGTVTLRTAEPYSKPRIRHKFLTEESDRARMRDGIRIAMEIARQPSLARHLRDPSDDARRGLVPIDASDAAIGEYVKRTAFAFWHPCGTCAIADVTDPQLRVNGLENVRVADTSVMPRLITGNTNAPAIMIGTRAAELITGDATRVPDSAAGVARSPQAI